MSLLILGTANSGRDNTPVNILSDVLSEFAPQTTQTINVSSTTNSATLTTPIWGSEITAYNYQSKLTQIYPYNLSATGTALTWGALGYIDYWQLNYDSLPPTTDLSLQARLVDNYSQDYYVWKIGGDIAKISMGSVKLYAPYSGIQLNDTRVTITDNNFYFSVPNTLGQVGTQIIFSSPQNLSDQINSLFLKNQCPFKAVASGTLALISGMYTFAGGRVGDLTDLANSVQAIEWDDWSSILLPPGCSSAQILSILNSANTESIIFAGSDSSLSTLSDADYIAQLNTLSISDPRLFIIPGWTYITGNYTDQKTLVSLAATFAGQWQNGNPTHQPTGLQGILPLWTPSELHSLSTHTSPYTRFIQTDWSCYGASTSDGGDGLRARLRYNITDKLRKGFLPLIGKEPSPDILTLADTFLTDIPEARSITTNSTLFLDTLTVDIQARRWGETRSIQFNFSTKL